MKPHEDVRNVVDHYKGVSVEVIAEDMRAKSFPVHVAIENLQHDFNIGSIVRTANAFNVRSVHIIGRRHWNRRGAMATEKYLDLFHHATIEEFRAWANNENLKLYAVDNVPGAIEIGEFKPAYPCVLVFGQEGPGISSELMAICDAIVMIRQYGSTRSLNVAAAASIVLHTVVERYRTL